MSIAYDMDILPPMVLQGMAKRLRTYADDLEIQARDNDQRIHASVLQHQEIQKINQACTDLGELILSGVEVERAVTQIAERHQIAAERLKIIWPSYNTKLKKKTAIEREHRIMVMYRAGLDNAQIAAKENVTGRHIRRVIKERLDDMATMIRQ